MVDIILITTFFPTDRQANQSSQSAESQKTKRTRKVSSEACSAERRDLKVICNINNKKTTITHRNVLKTP